MTEPTLAPPSVGQAGLTDTTVEAGLEIKVRSQWDYARRRFLRHRLAMGGLIGLIIIFGAGIFANYVAPYTYDGIDLNNILARADDGGAPLLRHGRDRARLLQPRHLRHPHLRGGRRRRRRPLVADRAHHRGDRRLLQRLARQHPDARHRPHAHAALPRDPAHGGGAARHRQPVACHVHPRGALLDVDRPRRARHLPLAAREGVRRGGEGRRRGRPADHVPPHPSEHARPDRRQRHARGGDGDPRRGGALLPRLRDQAADAVARRARRRRANEPAAVVADRLPGV